MRPRPLTPLAAIFRWVAWIIFAAIVVMTLGPVSARPTTPFSANFDRLAAYLVLGGCFALAYPRRLYLLALALVARLTASNGPKTWS